MASSIWIPVTFARRIHFFYHFSTCCSFAALFLWAFPAVEKVQNGPTLDGPAEHLNLPPFHENDANRKEIMWRIFSCHQTPKTLSVTRSYIVENTNRYFLPKTQKIPVLVENDGFSTKRKFVFRKETHQRFFLKSKTSLRKHARVIFGAEINFVNLYERQMLDPSRRS